MDRKEMKNSDIDNYNDKVIEVNIIYLLWDYSIKKM